MQLRRLFLARLRDVQARRGAITAALTQAVPSDVQHRQSTVAQLEVSRHVHPSHIGRVCIAMKALPMRLTMSLSVRELQPHEPLHVIW